MTPGVLAVLFASFVGFCSIVLALIDGRRVALRDAELDRLEAAREADADEAALTYNALVAELEVLRCYDLDAFHDGELTPARAAAFRPHLVTCAACRSGLKDLMIIGAIASTAPRAH